MTTQAYMAIIFYLHDPWVLGVSVYPRIDTHGAECFSAVELMPSSHHERETLISVLCVGLCASHTLDRPANYSHLNHCSWASSLRFTKAFVMFNTGMLRLAPGVACANLESQCSAPKPQQTSLADMLTCL